MSVQPIQAHFTACELFHHFEFISGVPRLREERVWQRQQAGRARGTTLLEPRSSVSMMHELNLFNILHLNLFILQPLLVRVHGTRGRLPPRPPAGAGAGAARARAAAPRGAAFLRGAAGAVRDGRVEQGITHMRRLCTRQPSFYYPSLLYCILIWSTPSTTLCERHMCVLPRVVSRPRAYLECRGPSSTGRCPSEITMRGRWVQSS